MRTGLIPALIVTAGLVAAALSGCSASAGADASCVVKSGQASDAITAKGDFGKTVTAKVPTPLKVTTTERSTLIQGTGAPLQKGQYAHLSLTFFDATTGAATQAGSSYYPISASGLQQVTGLAKALQCVRVGSRVAVVLSPKQGASVLGAASGDSAVVVADVLKSYPTRATGRPVPSTPGFPGVVLTPSGRPGVTDLADVKAPKTLKKALLKKGDGAVLKKGDTVVANFLTVPLSDPSSASSSWSSDAPVPLSLSTTTDDVTKALIGERIGSQLELLVPKKDDAQDGASVVVIDLLGLQK